MTRFAVPRLLNSGQPEQSLSGEQIEHEILKSGDLSKKRFNVTSVGVRHSYGEQGDRSVHALEEPSQWRSPAGFVGNSGLRVLCGTNCGNARGCRGPTQQGRDQNLGRAIVEGPGGG
jgi:hypothetical protein